MSDLTAKQQRFVAEYLVDLNATQAAIRAGYSPRTANEQGARMLAKDSIAQLVSEGAAKRLHKIEVTARDVLEGLLVEATRTGEGASHGARVQAWGLLGKYHKLFTDKIEHSIDETLATLVMKSMAKKPDAK